MHDNQGLTKQARRLAQRLDEAAKCIRDLCQAIDNTNSSVAISTPWDIGRSAGLSIRSTKVLVRLGIESLRELSDFSKTDLMGVRNCGMTSVVEISDMMKDQGFKLKDENEPSETNEKQ